MEDLILKLSSDDLVALKAKYQSNPSLITLIDSVLEQKKIEDAKNAKALEFTNQVSELVGMLGVPPEAIYNLYIRYGDVEVPEGDPVEVEVVGKDGNKHTETRTPTIKVKKWIVETNKAISTSTKSNNGTSTKSTKRSITISKREGNNLVPVGNFTNATKACNHLKLDIGGDSATRVLQRNGYIVDQYSGEDVIA